jgi:hypothetical protein
MRFGVNEAKPDFVQRRGRGIFVETKFKMFSAPSCRAAAGGEGGQERHIPAK